MSSVNQLVESCMAEIERETLASTDGLGPYIEPLVRRIAPDAFVEVYALVLARLPSVGGEAN